MEPGWSCRVRTYRWTWNWLLWLLGTKFLHGLVVLFLLLSHEDVFISKVQIKHTNKVSTCLGVFSCMLLTLMSDTYLFLLLVEIVDDDADEQVEGEEGAEDDENDKVDVHVQVRLVLRLVLQLKRREIMN